MAKSKGFTDADRNSVEARKRIKRQRKGSGGRGSRVWLRMRRRVRKGLLKR